MEPSNVNNLNGVSNFGLGDEEAVIPTEAIDESVDEVVEDTNTKTNGKRTTKSKKA